MQYYLIVNEGTLVHSEWVMSYPRHMVLAQMCMQSADYMSRVMALRNTDGVKIILDNGAHEGAVVDPNDYARLVMAIKPDVAVMPDIPGTARQVSRDRSLKWMHDLAAIWQDWDSLTYMYVPQGESDTQVIDEFDWAISELDPARFMLSASIINCLHWGDSERARLEMLDDIMSNDDAAGFRFHLLGAKWDPTEDYHQWPNVVSIDSLKPCKCALKRVVYPTHTPSLSLASTQIAKDNRLAANVHTFEVMYGCSQSGSAVDATVADDTTVDDATDGDGTND